MNLHDATNLSPDMLSQRFQLLAANATEYALFLVAPDGRVLCWNRGAERSFGFRADEIVGQHFSRFFTPEDVISGQPEYELKTAQENGYAGGTRWQVRKDGSRFWCRSNTTVLHDEARQLHAFARVMHDLTDTQEREAEAKRSHGLAEANRGKDEFMALLAHELRNPLSPIISATAILRQVRTSDPIIQQAGGVIERQVRQMVRLVDDLLDVSRITNGKLRLKTEKMDLRSAMHRAVASVRSLLDSRRHEFTLLLPTEPLWIDADPGRLEQVAVNLLTNAAAYTDPGGVIRMSVAREGDDAVVRVADNGVGIPPDMLPRVFGLFTQVDSSLSRSHGGLGIGLALVRTLVEMHGGRVTAASGGLGKGSEFAFKLPAVPAPPGPGEAAATFESHRTAARPLRVLVVEDNVDAGDSLAILLQLYGHDVRLARTGPSALDVAAGFRPDLVLLDIGLPGMDGCEVARRLRADARTAGATLCALSGYTPSEADRLRLQPDESGFDHHFVKPVGSDTLIGLLKTFE